MTWYIDTDTLAAGRDVEGLGRAGGVPQEAFEEPVGLMRKAREEAEAYTSI